MRWGVQLQGQTGLHMHTVPPYSTIATLNKKQKHGTSVSGSLACDTLDIFGVIELIGANRSPTLLDFKSGTNTFNAGEHEYQIWFWPANQQILKSCDTDKKTGAARPTSFQHPPPSSRKEPTCQTWSASIRKVSGITSSKTQQQCVGGQTVWTRQRSAATMERSSKSSRIINGKWHLQSSTILVHVQEKNAGQNMVCREHFWVPKSYTKQVHRSHWRSGPAS